MLEPDGGKSIMCGVKQRTEKNVELDASEHALGTLFIRSFLI